MFVPVAIEAPALQVVAANSEAVVYSQGTNGILTAEDPKEGGQVELDASSVVPIAKIAVGPAGIAVAGSNGVLIWPLPEFEREEIGDPILFPEGAVDVVWSGKNWVLAQVFDNDLVSCRLHTGSDKKFVGDRYASCSVGASGKLPYFFNDRFRVPTENTRVGNTGCEEVLVDRYLTIDDVPYYVGYPTSFAVLDSNQLVVLGLDSRVALVDYQGQGMTVDVNVVPQAIGAVKVGNSYEVYISHETGVGQLTVSLDLKPLVPSAAEDHESLPLPLPSGFVLTSSNRTPFQPRKGTANVVEEAKQAEDLGEDEEIQEMDDARAPLGAEQKGEAMEGVTYDFPEAVNEEDAAHGVVPAHPAPATSTVPAKRVHKGPPIDEIGDGFPEAVNEVEASSPTHSFTELESPPLSPDAVPTEPVAEDNSHYEPISDAFPESVNEVDAAHGTLGANLQLPYKGQPKPVQRASPLQDISDEFPEAVNEQEATVVPHATPKRATVDDSYAFPEAVNEQEASQSPPSHHSDSGTVPRYNFDHTVLQLRREIERLALHLDPYNHNVANSSRVNSNTIVNSVYRNLGLSLPEDDDIANPKPYTGNGASIPSPPAAMDLSDDEVKSMPTSISDAFAQIMDGKRPYYFIESHREELDEYLAKVDPEHQQMLKLVLIDAFPASNLAQELKASLGEPLIDKNVYGSVVHGDNWGLSDLVRGKPSAVEQERA